MSTNPPNPPLPPFDTTEFQIRFALQVERLGLLMESVKQSDARNDQWRRETTTAIESLRMDIADLKVSHRELTERLKEVEREVLELKAEVAAKVGTVWFRSLWSVLLGLGVILTALGGLVTMAKALGWIH